VESTEREPTIAPLWELQAPAILLGAATAQPPVVKDSTAEAKDGDSEATEPVATMPPVDERAGKLEVSSSAFVEASAPRSLAVTVTTKNVGLRPIVAAIRPWMMSLRIDSPGVETQMCYADNTQRTLPRDAYRPIAPGASTSFSVLLAEVCPNGVFPKPGLYRVTPIVAAKTTTNGVDIDTITLTGREPSLVRLSGANEPFYGDPPKATVPPVEQPLTEN
jgi:hypothetical protein